MRCSHCGRPTPSFVCGVCQIDSSPIDDGREDEELLDDFDREQYVECQELSDEDGWFYPDEDED